MRAGGPDGGGRPVTDTEDPEAAMPDADPAPELSPDGVPAGPEVSDKVLQLLYRGGSGDCAATLHEWYDLGGMLARVTESAPQCGIRGVGLLATALRERAAGPLHAVSALLVSL